MQKKDPQILPCEDFQVLNRRNEQILNALLFYSTPPCFFKAVHHCRFSKVSLLKPLPPLVVFAGFFAMTLVARAIELFLMLVPFQRPACFCPGALSF